MANADALSVILAARYGSAGESALLDPPVRNALRVTVRGRACVAKLLGYAVGPGAEAYNRRLSDGFAMETYTYARLSRWPVTLVDAFSAQAGHVVVTTEYKGRPWGTYEPSEKSDRTVARRLIRQLRAVHRAGVAHGDLILQNILFRPPCGVAIIDFEKSQRSSPEATSWDYRTLVEALLWPRNTRGVAFCVLRALPTELAKRTFASAIGNMADNANAHLDAARRECQERRR